MEKEDTVEKEDLTNNTPRAMLSIQNFQDQTRIKEINTVNNLIDLDFQDFQECLDNFNNNNNNKEITLYSD